MEDQITNGFAVVAVVLSVIGGGLIFIFWVLCLMQLPNSFYNIYRDSYDGEDRITVFFAVAPILVVIPFVIGYFGWIKIV